MSEAAPLLDFGAYHRTRVAGPDYSRNQPPRVVSACVEDRSDELPAGGAVTSIESGRRMRPAIKRPATAGPANVRRSADIEDIFRQYIDPVHRFIYRQVGNRQDAEDLTSEVFLTASRSLDVTRADHAIGRWLFTVSRTVIADHWRRHYRVPPLVDIDDLQLAEIVPAESGEERFETKSRTVARILDRLPERHRKVLELRFLRGYTIVETAQELGITVENVKITQHRALAKAVDTVGDQS
ncbi:MAG TPA: sigma-70 family RNA polymerase sigma factor [Chloroflexota bacterium]|nr:sigma-70 family RNA polymerase sigma factor [Chloroflexota bacterium]